MAGPLDAIEAFMETPAYAGRFEHDAARNYRFFLTTNPLGFHRRVR